MELDELHEKGILVCVLHENWKTLGLTPLYLFKLVERGWTYEEICFVLGRTIGPDFADVKVGTWIDRLIEQGVKVSDTDPFIELLDKLMFVYLELYGDELVGRRSN